MKEMRYEMKESESRTSTERETMGAVWKSEKNSWSPTFWPSAFIYYTKLAHQMAQHLQIFFLQSTNNSSTFWTITCIGLIQF